MSPYVCKLVIVALATLCATSDRVVVAENSADVFTRRILPIAKSNRASSCTECHFAGVDLRQYILEDSEQTFSALQKAGLIDLREPEKSKLLTFINRKPEKEDELLAKVRQEEYKAFRTWIELAVKEPRGSIPVATTKPIGSPSPIEVVRHARKDRVLRSFVENIWVDMERCQNCHSPDKNQRLIEKHGESISWISPEDPSGTLAKCLEQGIIDLEEPEKSLLLLKPLAVVDHGGHRKFSMGSDPDKRFRRFLTDFASLVANKYVRATDLPIDDVEIRYATGQQLRITGLPQEWRDKLLRVDIYRWEGQSWSAVRVATGDGYVNGPQRLWQNMILGIARRNQPDAIVDALEKRLLPAGKYHAKLYLDREEKLVSQRDYVLGANEFVGSVEFSGQWKPGYQPPKIAEFTSKD